MSRAKLQVQEEVSPNLIPMIDIMFLLLLFFMLGADMGQQEIEAVVLPQAYSVKEEKGGAGDRSDKLIVNIHHRHDVTCSDVGFEGQVCRDPKHWRIGIRGKDFSNLKQLEQELMNQGNRGRTTKMDKLSAGQQVPVSERPVMIRADASGPYGLVQEVVNACAKVGIYKIEVGAARPADADAVEAKARTAPGAK